MLADSASLTIAEASDQRLLYEELVRGTHADGPLGVITFCVSTTDFASGKGDIFVAAGLGRYLAELGWGIRFWPEERWGEELDTDIAVVMLESFVPGLVGTETRIIGWNRNWTITWANLPYLSEFDEIWCSSEASAELVQKSFAGPVAVVPIAADPALFSLGDSARTLAVSTTVNDWGVEREITRSVSTLASEVDLWWFGTSHFSVRPVPGIHRRPLVDYFSVNSIYQQSVLVLDDAIDSAKEFGAQNSRLFEAIAAGAVPITNCETGLAELGLAEVPTYAGEADLAKTVSGLLENADERAELQSRLRAVVLTRHTFEARAAQVHPRLTALRTTPVRRSGRSPVLVMAALDRNRLIAAQTKLETAHRAIAKLDALSATAMAGLADTKLQLEATAQDRDNLAMELARTTSSRTFRLVVSVNRWQQRVRATFSGPRAR